MPSLLCLAVLCVPPAEGVPPAKALPRTDGAAAGAAISAVRWGYGPAGPEQLALRWETDRPAASAVRFGPPGAPAEERRVEGERRRHEVTVPAGRTGAYQVSGPDGWSSPAPLPAAPAEELRVAFVANWQGRPDLSALLADDPHLLVSAGDQVADLHSGCGEGAVACTAPFARLIDDYPALFRSVPYLPTLGNHDRQIRERGPEPPAEPVYDVDAVALRAFFTLPSEPEWRWRLTLPEFGLRLTSVDLNHTSDVGTTWQSCHAFDAGSEQLNWFEDRPAEEAAFRVTVYNERNATVRGLAGGRWGAALEGETCVIAGFGHFAERAEPPGSAVFLNTSLHGRGDRYPDPHTRFLAGEDGYVLLRIARGGPMTAELKNLDGETLDAVRFPR
ncbi:hypothetical protein [Alienimonas californiensis]|uniref:Calcineurin-like phosphoesterase domain-containing protein n=1 Tax=Alienimonas californiensis TaxID=2527989 RepID=A0A517P7L6_9PLAN|nr:hypothetical protein [Alienimonas californiensis]QDT15368.1 hypothetical protein CA12_14530 [Alienimonas californiensis]